MIAERQIWLTGLLIASLAILGCSQEGEPTSAVEPAPGDTVLIPQAEVKTEIDLSATLAVIETNKGTMEMEFLTGAPTTAQHVAQLIQKRFYDLGMRFYYVDDSVVQTGDPTNTGTEGSSTSVALEVWQDQDFRIGSVGMAYPDGDPDGATSQLFICKEDISAFNSKYTLVGQVMSGLDVLQAIEQGDRLIKVSLKQKAQS